MVYGVVGRIIQDVGVNVLRSTKDSRGVLWARSGLFTLRQVCLFRLSVAPRSSRFKEGEVATTDNANDPDVIFSQTGQWPLPVGPESDTVSCSFVEDL